MRLAAVLEVKQQAEDRYDLVDGNLESRAGMAENGVHTRSIGVFCELITRIRTPEGSVKLHGMPSVKLRLER